MGKSESYFSGIDLTFLMRSSQADESTKQVLFFHSEALNRWAAVIETLFEAQEKLERQFMILERDFEGLDAQFEELKLKLEKEG